ncbi:DUF956 family protein [Limosilactobacillus ingluviei]|uniref:DUF956 family protein n=1 Tax=Limosilactobacillus ingluviei TaxID=148604 RepID=A0A0R2GWU0_9LACO|nr:DUF956 family protein [Limosilactobacillus ingluviei]KRN44984.1 hypothetical protein IV41_GL001852 [Limosilactobacillus ingluviei]HJG49456.1 DUF956 family protein [Limosilactobacillus ingluviei]
MVESLNKKAELIAKGTYFTTFSAYGQIMIGDEGFEFYEDRNVQNFVQIPWDEIDLVVASLLFGGKWIPRFKIQTKRNGSFIFAAREPKRVLKAMTNHIDPNHVVRALTFTQNLTRNLKTLWHRRQSK